MRTDIRETSEGTGIAGSRRGRTAGMRQAASDAFVGLEPLTVDAAFADETMPMHADRGSRRDASHVGDGGNVAGSSQEPATADDQLLRSLSAQLELLHQQQREIRLLLDQAGRRRVDRIAN